MKRTKVTQLSLTIVAYTAILFLAGHFDLTSAQLLKSDRELAGLKGSVRTVLVERRSDAGTMERDELTTFDPDGNITERIQFDDRGEAKSKEVFNYDPAHRLKEEITYDGKNALTWKVAYAYDSDGRRTEALSYDGSGKQTAKWVYAYDARGNLAHEASDGLLSDSVNFIYNSKGQLIKRAQKHMLLTTETEYEYDPDGKLIQKRSQDPDDQTTRFDSTGNKMEEYGTLLGKHYSKKYSYQWDSHGNWTESTVEITRESFSSGPPQTGSIFRSPWTRSSEVIHRTITYY